MYPTSFFVGWYTMLTVQKFGGSSVADAEKIKRAAGIIAACAGEGRAVKHDG